MMLGLLHRLSGLQFALALTLGLRILYSGIAALLVPHLELDPELIRSNQLTEHLMQRSDGLPYLLLGVWERFDTLWYVHIASYGYDTVNAVVFYPLYPILIRTLSVVIPQPLAAALLISTAASFFFFWGLWKLLVLDLTSGQVRRVLTVCAFWPATFIWFCGYPDSLMVACIVWSIYFGRTGRWWAAGMTGFLAGLAKAAGALVIVPLAVLFWRDRAWRALPAVLCLCGPVAYFVFLALYGRPLPPEVYPQYWRTEVAFPWVTLVDSIKEAAREYNLALRLNLAALFSVAILSLWRKLSWEYRLYSLSALCFFLLKKTDPLLQSTARYVVCIFPAYVSMARLLDDWARLSVGLLFLGAVNCFLLWQFLEWSLLV